MEKLSILLLMIFFLLCCNNLTMLNINVAIISMTRPVQEEKLTNKISICPNTTLFRSEIQDEMYVEQNLNLEDTYDWSNYEKRMVVSSTHWIGWLMVLPSGIMTQKYGSKIIVGYAVAISSTMSSIIPFVAEYGPNGVMWVRMIQGIFMSMPLPSGIMTITGNWSSEENRGKFVAAVLGGMGTSFCIGSYLFGYICRYIHWKYVFHLTSLCGILWTIGWYFLVFDSPSVHPTIRREEKSKILEKKKYLTNNTKIPIPWKEILTSLPVNLVYFNSGAVIVSMFVLGTFMPLYFNDIFGFDSNQSGIIISLSQVIGTVFTFSLGWFTDYFLKKQWLSTTNTRKLFGAIGCISSTVPLILMAFSKCDAIAVIVYSVLSSAFRYILVFGIEPAIVDMSPNFCGVTHGLMGTTSELMMLSFSLGMGYLTKVLPTEEFWKVIFLLTAIINIIPSALFTVWGSAELQPWNQGPKYFRNRPVSQDNHLQPLNKFECYVREC